MTRPGVSSFGRLGCGAHSAVSSSGVGRAPNSTSSRVRSMKASSSDACCGVSSCSAMPCGGRGVADLLGREAVDLERAALAVRER